MANKISITQKILLYEFHLHLLGDMKMGATLLKKFKGANTLWQIAVKTDIPSFDTNIHEN